MKILLKKASLLFAILTCCFFTAHAQTDTIRVMAYNTLDFGIGSCQTATNSSIVPLYADLKTIVKYANPDIIGLDKMQCIKLNLSDQYGISSPYFPDTIISECLNAAYPGRYNWCPFTDQSQCNNGDGTVLFYNQAKIGYVSTTVLYYGLEDIDLYKLYYKDAYLSTTHDTTFLYVIPCHTISGTDETGRDHQDSTVMNKLMALFTSLPNLIYMGDFNVHASTEAGYAYITQTNTNANFILNDPPFSPDGELSYPNNWNNGNATQAFFTTSTRSGSLPNSCGTPGGAKDWYDHIFLSPSLANGTDSIKYIRNSYVDIGNNGNRANLDVNDSTTLGKNLSAPSSVLNALYYFSDKYPLLVSLAVGIHPTVVATTNNTQAKLISFWDFNQTRPFGGAGTDSLGTRFSYDNEYTTFAGSQDSIKKTQPLYPNYTTNAPTTAKILGGCHPKTVSDPIQNGSGGSAYNDYSSNKYNYYHGSDSNSGGGNQYIKTINPVIFDTIFLYLPTIGYQNVLLNYAISASSTHGANYNIFSYSTNGGISWKNLTTEMDTFNISGVRRPDTLQMLNPTTDASGWYPVNINFSSDPSVNNNANFILRWIYGGINVTGTSGNDRYDNIALIGDSICPTISSQPANVILCDDGGNTSFSVGTTGGTSVTYQWWVNAGSGYTAISNTGIYSGATTNILTIIGATSSMNGYRYECKVSNISCGTMISNTAMLTIDPTLSAGISATTNQTCTGNGSATASQNGGTSPYTYVWSPGGQTTITATNLIGGVYTVTVRDADGCSAIAQTTVQSVVTVSISSVTSIECTTNGSATASVSGGTSPYTYSWSNGQTNVTATGLTAGTYTIIVHDNANCSASTTAIISTIMPLRDSIVSGTHVIHYWDFNNVEISTTDSLGTSTYPLIAPYTLLPSTPGYITYSRPNGSGDGILDGFVPISPPTPPYCYLNDLPLLGEDSGSVATGNTAIRATNPSTGTYMYLNLPTTGYTNIVLNYAVSASSSKGATYNVLSYSTNRGITWKNLTRAMDTFNISGVYRPDTLMITNSLTDASNWQLKSINFSSDPSVSNNPNFILRWAFDGSTTSGTTGNDRYDNISVIGTKEESCNGGNNVTLTVGVKYGVSPYTYAWSPSGGSAAMASNLAAGNYTVIVTDANGCSASSSNIIYQPVALSATASIISNVSCSGGNNGSASASPSGGTSPYTYSWTPLGGTNSTATGLSLGIYTVTVNDNCGASATAEVSITQPTLIGISTTQSNVSCYGGVGSATASISGGTSPYTYSWNNAGSQAAATATGLSAGSYTITVKDNNGCSMNAPVNIIQPALLLIATSQTNVSCYGGVGSATASSSGGTSPYTYLWTNGQTTAKATELSAGNYTVIVTDRNGCNINASVNITQPVSAIGVTTSQSNIACYGGVGSTTVSVSGGISPYTYLWNDASSQATAIATGLSAGIYTVTVTDNNQCNINTSVNITQPALLLISTSQTNVLCYGGVGSATASISGGTSPYTYSWNDAGSQATAAAAGLSTGIYTVSVTDNNGCMINVSVNLTQPALLGISTSQTNVLCYGGIASATASISGGTSPYTYLWNDGSSQATATATGLSTGIYTVTVTDLNGCTATASATITQPLSALGVTIASYTNSSGCGSNGSAIANSTGGTSPYTYSWSNGQTTATATGLSAGIYTLTATDNNGCIINASVSITQPLSSLKISTSQTNVSCYGGVGNATASVSGGTSPYTYLWNDASSQATATATGLTAGSYTIIATDNNGCTINTSVTLTEPLVLAISTSESNVLCYGGFGSGTASVSGGVSPYTYLWNDGSSQVTASATGLSAGNYTVSVTDNHGCSINASVTITEPASGLAANASITTNVLCYGSNTGIAVSAPSGGTSPYTYLWSNNETAASATGLSAGNYTVTVSDNHGCSTTAGITIIEPSSALGVSISGHTNGSGCGSNGNATASISGGTSPYTYLWSNTETTATATGLAGGTFTITATDNHGCVANATVVITQAPEIAISIASQTNVLCYGGTGSAVANAATGGTSPYTYMWSNGKSTLSVTGLSAGNYTITATGHNGCSTNAYVTITQPAAALESSVASLTNASCHGEHGSASIGVSGGTSPYTYSWTPNVSSVATASGLTAGTYTVIVKDLHGCADAKVTVIITQPGTLRDSLVADSKLTELDEPFSNVSCNGGDNGKITIGVKAGTAPYTYSWTPNVSTTATATGLTAGTYSVLVTDKNGCSGTAGTLSITITQPTGLRDSISVLTEVACNGETGAATIGVKGGTSPYTYVWEPIGKTKAAEIGLSAGIYTVTVTDHNGCGNSVVVTITQPAPIRDSVIAASYLYPLCHGEATGSATVGIKGGTSPYTYTWSKGATNNTTAIGTGLSAGTYTVVVKDAHGCEEGKGVVIVVITQPGSIRDSSVTVDKANVSCNGGNNGQITVGVKYGTPPYTYTWTPNVSTTATATGLTAGTYTISITDINACSSSVSTLKVVVTQPSVLRDSLIGLTQISCNGGSGSVGVGVKGGTSPYTYAWSPIGKTTAKISDLTVGTYTVTVTDKHGCGNTLEAIITQPGVFYDSVASISYPVCHGETGSATVGVKGGTSPYTYSWSKGAISTTGSATGLLAGTYTLTIEDAHKCTEIKRTIVITQPAAIRDSSIVADRINISCNGGDNGSATAGVRYGVSPFTYLWSPGDQTTATATGLTAGTYTLTVTDNNGCSSTTKETAIITQPSVLTATIANVCKAGVGSFTASGSGGVSPYTYSWNNGSTNKEITGLSSGVFTVTVTDKNGCEATAEASVCPPSDYTGPTGENTDSYSSNQAIDIVLYPNPNTGQFTITGLQKEMLIEVYSYTGQRIRSLTTNGDGALQMSLSDQPNGIYLIRILSSNGNILSLKKVVKTQ